MEFGKWDCRILSNCVPELPAHGGGYQIEISDGWVTLHDEGEKYSSRAKVARLLRERMKDDIRLDAIEKMEKWMKGY